MYSYSNWFLTPTPNWRSISGRSIQNGGLKTKKATKNYTNTNPLSKKPRPTVQSPSLNPVVAQNVKFATKNSSTSKKKFLTNNSCILTTTKTAVKTNHSTREWPTETWTAKGLNKTPISSELRLNNLEKMARVLDPSFCGSVYYVRNRVNTLTIWWIMWILSTENRWPVFVEFVGKSLIGRRVW